MSTPTVTSSLQTFKDELALDRLWPRPSMARVRSITTGLTGVGIVTLAILHPDTPHISYNAIAGATLLMGAIACKQWLLTCYHNTAYYRGLSSYISSKNFSQATLTYDVAESLTGNEHDLTAAFLTGPFGPSICLRAGLTKKGVTEFLATPRSLLSTDALTLETKRSTTLIDVVTMITTHDQDFRHFVTASGSTPEIVLDCCRFMMGAYYKAKRSERFWSRDELSRRGALGRRLGFGLQQETLPHTIPVYDTDAAVQPGEEKLIQSLTHILAASHDSNVLLVSPQGMGDRHIVGTLARHFRTGTALNALSGQHFLAIDPLSFSATYESPDELEDALATLFSNAVEAGNITLVLYDALSIIEHFTTRGVPFVQICEDYLGRSGLHLILTTTPADAVTLKHNFHNLTYRCEEVVVTPPHTDDMLHYIEEHVFAVEGKYRVLFLYNAIEALAQALFTHSEPTYAMAKKLLIRLAEDARESGKKVVTRDDVHTYLSQTTGIPMGPLTDYERDFLLHAEDLLGQQIVGQPRALKALASALRRSRTNLTTTDKPHGSFLFLGPTGVGKTETAKALASLYFHNPQALLRIDMNEYTTASDLGRLIGTEQQKGILAEALAENPYRILLLDEFEKADRSIQHLFLQALDEGYVTTGGGEQINVRHCLIIATSNAGGELIAKTNEQRTDVPALDSNIIEHIIEHKLLSPELLNRFDDIIIYDTLSPRDELTIGNHLVAELTTRLRDKGFGLQVESEAIRALVDHAHHPEFGARPLRHHLTTVLDDIIATHIIRGDVKPGDTITITAADIQK